MIGAAATPGARRRPCSHCAGTGTQFRLELEGTYRIRVAPQKAGNEIERLPARRDGVGTP